MLYVRYQINRSLLACEANSEGADYDGHCEKEVLMPIEEFSKMPKSIMMFNNLGRWYDVICGSDNEETIAARAVAINTKEAFETLKEMGLENL